MTSPVIQPAATLSRNIARSATPSASPTRGNGMQIRWPSHSCGESVISATRSVRISPGRMLLTRTQLHQVVDRRFGDLVDAEPSVGVAGRDRRDSNE
jgi:hypothetical protein